MPATADSSSAAAIVAPAMISTNQFKNGNHIEVEGTVFKILEFQHVKPGKGKAFDLDELRRTNDGAVIEPYVPGRREGGPVRTEARKMQFLYADGTDPTSWTSRATSRSRSPSVGLRTR